MQVVSDLPPHLASSSCPSVSADPLATGCFSVSERPIQQNAAPGSESRHSPLPAPPLRATAEKSFVKRAAKRTSAAAPHLQELSRSHLQFPAASDNDVSIGQYDNHLQPQLGVIAQRHGKIAVQQRSRDTEQTNRSARSPQRAQKKNVYSLGLPERRPRQIGRPSTEDEQPERVVARLKRENKRERYIPGAISTFAR